jgi:hypothetical protein
LVDWLVGLDWVGLILFWFGLVGWLLITPLGVASLFCCLIGFLLACVVDFFLLRLRGCLVDGLVD